MKGNAYAHEYAAHELAQGNGLHLQGILGCLGHTNKLLQYAVRLEDGLHIEHVICRRLAHVGEMDSHPLQHPVQPSQQGRGVCSLPGACPFLLITQQTGIGMPPHCLQEGIAKGLPGPVIAIGLQTGQCHDETVHRSVCQGESHGHVHLSHLFRQCMQYGMQERLVAQDHRIVVVCGIPRFA